VDKVTTIAYLLYISSKNQDIKEKAIQLLNGDLSIRDLKRIPALRAHLTMVETILKKNQIDKKKIQQFVEEFMIVEV